jgi:beta-phosphoglucomutase-like phosphatase (HAD superfamily)
LPETRTVSDPADSTSGLTLIELVGPIVDDRGLVARTLREVIGEAGLSLRPEATAAVIGASAAYAVATLMGGHGRLEDEAAVAEVERRWGAALGRGELALQPGAVDALNAISARGPLAVLSNLPEPAVSSWVEQNFSGMAIASGSRGLPHPDAIVAAAAAADVPVGSATVLAHSPAVLLAAAQAGVGRIVLVGPGSSPWTELVPVTARAATLAEWCGGGEKVKRET